MNSIFKTFKKLFSNHQLSVMVLFIALLVIIMVFFGKMITPFIASVVVAYLLQGVVKRLNRFMPRMLSVNIVFFAFLTFVLCVLIIVLPLMLNQLKDFLTSAPTYINLGKDLIMSFPQKHPDILSPEQASKIITVISEEATSFAQNALSGGVIAPLVGFVSLIIYLILVPLMVFFLLKDKDVIIGWLGRYLPFENVLLRDVWKDVDNQIGNYIRGKFTEIIIIWFATFLGFTLAPTSTPLKYSMLLSFMVGISVLIPYIGATVVTLPVMIVAFVQFGLGTTDFYIIIAIYFVIQIIDGNVLVPLIFSEAVNIHPVGIIVAILIFGGLWGFWGIFFAIPLATCIKAIINAWSQSVALDNADNSSNLALEDSVKKNSSYN